MPLITPVKENTMCNIPFFTGISTFLTGFYLFRVYNALLISRADWLPSLVR